MAEAIYKFITGSDAEIKQFNDTERSFTAWASRSSIDRDDEEIDAAGWITKDYRKNPVVPLFHEYRFPVAKSLWEKLEPKDKPIGLLFKPQFAETALGQEAYYLYKEGFMNAFSVGFIPLEWEDSDGELHSRDKDGDFDIWQAGYIEQKKKRPWRKYLKQTLLEISGVLVPAHPDALVEARSFVKTPELGKYLDDMINKDRKPMIAIPDQLVKSKELFNYTDDDIQEFKDTFTLTLDYELFMALVGITQKLHKIGTDQKGDLQSELCGLSLDLNDILNGQPPKWYESGQEKHIDTINASEYIDEDIDIDLDELLGLDGDALDETGDISIDDVGILGDVGDDAEIDIDIEGL